MDSPTASVLARHRARKASHGYVRVELSLRQDDVALVRRVAAALSDSAQRTAARRLLHEHFATPPTQSLKALLAAAPLDGIDLTRDRDFGSDVDL